MDSLLHRARIDAKHLTLDAIRARDPALADEIHALVRQAERAQLGSSLKDLPDDVRAKIASIDLTRTTGNAVEHLRLRLVELDVNNEHIQKIVKHAKASNLGQPIPQNQPIATLPAVALQIAAAHVQEVTTLAGLTGPAATAIARAAPATSALTDATLTTLVSNNTLTATQAQALGFSVALYALVDENTLLATAIRSYSALPQLAGNPAASTADLAKLTAADWTTFLVSTLAPLPSGATPASVADALARRLAAIHPNVALTARLPQPDATQLTATLTTLAPLQPTPRVATANVAQFQTQPLTPTPPTAPQPTPAQTQLHQLSNAYPGLNLATLFADPHLPPATKASTATRRIGLVHQATAQLGDSQILRLNLGAGSADLAKLGLDKLGATAAEQAMVLSTFKAYQRVSAVTKSTDDMHALLGAGFTSAVSIGGLSLQTFVAQSGLDPVKTRGIWSTARTTLADLSLTTASIVDHTMGSFNGIAMNNQAPSAAQYLAQLPGYQDLFGNLTFCACKECRSILGPAA